MPRLASCVLIGVLLLSGCSRPSTLPAQEVLRRATVQSLQLQSAAFDATVKLSSERAGARSTFSANLTGTIALGGQQTAWSIVADASWDGKNRQRMGAHVEADVMTELNDTFVQARVVRFTPASPSAGGLESLLGKWWKVPGASMGTAVQGVTPDPRFLRAQSEVVRVVLDRGISSIRGRDAYHYDVTIDQEKLLAFLRRTAEERGEQFDSASVQADISRYEMNGELWIDAETFAVHSIAWTVTTKDANSGSLRLELHIDLSKHGAADPIVPPTQFDMLDQAAFLQLALPSLPLPPR